MRKHKPEASPAQWFLKYMHKISDRLTQVQNSIQQHALACGRSPETVQLIAVSKTQPVNALEEAYACGQRDFGENYLQEALEKMNALAHLPLRWHFIGPIQSNKTRTIAERFDWVHAVDRLPIAERLDRQRPADRGPLDICVQVNIDAEPSKAGCSPADSLALCQQIARLPRLRLRGLMAIPAPGTSAAAFTRLARLQASLCTDGKLSLDTLSMGMTDDLAEAIAAGATLVRVGTAIFGPRTHGSAALGSNNLPGSQPPSGEQ